MTLEEEYQEYKKKKLKLEEEYQQYKSQLTPTIQNNVKIEQDNGNGWFKKST